MSGPSLLKTPGYKRYLGHPNFERPAYGTDRSDAILYSVFGPHQAIRRRNALRAVTHDASRDVIWITGLQKISQCFFEQVAGFHFLDASLIERLVQCSTP